MATRDIVVVGASLGGLDAVSELVATLPADLPAAVFIIIHVAPNPPSILHAILQPRSRWPVLPAVDGATIRHGIVTVAISDHHLMFSGDRVRLTRGPRENRSRPAIDASLRSAALEFGPRCIGVVLTGSLDDGTAGLWALKDRGGIAVAQSPEEAEHPSMPRNAIQHVAVDHVVCLAELPALLSKLTRQRVDALPVARVDDTIAIEDRIAAGDDALQAGALTLGNPSMNTCPHCHGTLMEVRDAGPLRFRCHTGHVFSPGSLLVDLDKSIDESLWGVLRSIDERKFLLQQLIESSKLGGDDVAAQEYERQAEDARLRGNEIRALVMSPPEPVSGTNA